MTGASPQVAASDPRASVFVAANAGSGKTSTLVTRVARLLLAGAQPEAILCVTYTKAGAAEMQRRLFQQLGGWAVAKDDKLKDDLARIDEADRDLSAARALFARALETPGGLKIQTIHAFCEQLLRRFPLEAGVSPGFSVMDDTAARAVSKAARDRLADKAAAGEREALSEAYRHFSVELDWTSFNAMFDVFAARRAEIAAYAERCEFSGGFVADVWRRCGFAEPRSRADIEAEAMADIRWTRWDRAAEALLAGNGKTDQSLGLAMKAIGPQSSYEDVAAIFFTGSGTPKARLATKSVDPWAQEWLIEEQGRHVHTRTLLQAATVAENTVHALTLARAYGACYEDAKGARGQLDFTDLISRALQLLTVRADATWVLYKLDGGLEHVLVDEGQDTAPEQWDILRALTTEFFIGTGAGTTRRTMFAVADEKQSIFSFQGAAPERFEIERLRFEALVTGSGFRFATGMLRESWRSAPEILTFVDQVFSDDAARDGLYPAEGNVVSLPLNHVPLRDPAGCVDLWPLEVAGESVETDAWAPVDSEPEDSANRRLARRIARALRDMVESGDCVLDRDSRQMRPCGYGDMLILVRRRSALFHEIIRALKREGVPVGGADRLKLSDHGVFEDLMALARFARFVDDDLTLAGILRGPFCDMDESALFDLAHGRGGSLWRALETRASERPEWASAAQFLAWARDESARRTPFDLFTRVMERTDGAGRSMRQRLYTRMGAEGEDAADAFLAETLAMEDRGARDLETFLAMMSASEIEVKREAEEAARGGEGEVRVMTTHGAKGLEAPIVILPDTSTRATDRGGPLLDTADGGFLWAPRKADDCPASQAARERRAKASERESSRLLYVALTRARDRLILCGVEAQTARKERSWRDYMERAFTALEVDPFPLVGGGEGQRFGLPARRAARAPAPAASVAPAPAWVRATIPTEPPAARYASPSRLDEDAKALAPSPLSQVAGLGRFRRGDLIHGLLQRLPDLPLDQRETAAAAWLRREIDLTDEQREEMTATALALLADSRFAAVFGPGSRAEVALAGAVGTLPVSGRVDRLVVGEDRVLVIDFKTNRPAPDRVEAADPAYIRQMALYVALLREIFPGRAIEAALVWTDGPRLMPLPGALVDRALETLTIAG